MTFPEVQKFVADALGVNVETIEPNSDLRNDLGADTIDMIDLFLAMRNHCNVCVPFETAMKIGTVRQLQELAV